VGSTLKTVAGVFVLALIGNVMNLLSVPPYPQEIIKGIIIILAVLLQLFTNRTEKAV
jgi:ribose transport system permease protein